MASTTNADGEPDIGSAATRLTQMGDRTSLMVIDATLRGLPGESAKSAAGLSAAGLIAPAAPHMNAAEEVRELARRMLQATLDFRAAIHEPAE